MNYKMDNKTIEIFNQAGAILKGHFILSSGLHADTYFNKSIVSTDPKLTSQLCAMLVELINEKIGNRYKSIISPAMGAVIFGFETARQLDSPFYFLERSNNVFAFKRGFELPKGNCIIVEDIISTGLSVSEVIEKVKQSGLTPIAVFCLIDRSDGKVKLDVPIHSLCELKIKTYHANSLPPALASIPAQKMGSRRI